MYRFFHRTFPNLIKFSDESIQRREQIFKTQDVEEDEEERNVEEELIVFPPILNTSNKRIGLSVTHVAGRRRSLSTVFVRGKLEKKKRQDSIERFHRISSSIGFRISVNL